MSLVDKLNSLTWGGSSLYGEYAAEMKGEGTAKAQLARNNAIEDAAIADQKAIRDKVMASISKYLTGDVGFDPEQLAILKAQFLNQNSANFNQAGSAVLSSLRSRGAAGGDTPAGGDLARSLSALEGARATSASQGIAGIKLSDLQQALTNKFNAASVASGQSAQLSPTISASSSAGSNALNQYVSASNSGFGAMFLKSLGSGLGSGIAALATGGLTGGMSGIAKSLGGLSKGGTDLATNPSICWIAQAIYGENDPRVDRVRAYLLGPFSEHVIGRWLVRMYRRFGERIAKTPAVWLFKPLFDRII